jgi:hypothetical protein
MAHKYQFRTTEQWGLQTLLTYCKQYPVDATHLVEITEIASLCENTELLADCAAKWKRLIGQGESISLAIDVAERNGMKKLGGLAYHHMMLKGRDVWEADASLTRAQRIRLLSGHYTLSQLCDALPASPPVLTHDSSCPAPRRCGAAWSMLWRMITTNHHGFGEQVMNLQRADLLGRIMLAESVLDAMVSDDIPRSGCMDDMYEKCAELALKATQLKVKTVQRTLLSHFSDVD